MKSMFILFFVSFATNLLMQATGAVMGVFPSIVLGVGVGGGFLVGYYHATIEDSTVPF